VGGELRTARAIYDTPSVSLNGRLGVRVKLGYTRSEDWTRSRTARMDRTGKRSMHHRGDAAEESGARALP